MKIPLRFQITEYDCGTTSLINALVYLFEREEIPVALLKAIHRYTLDAEGESGIVGEGGTSPKAIEKLSYWIARYAGNNYVLITKIDDNFVYIFDPYYLEEDYYCKDGQVAVVLNQTFTHNRLVKPQRLMGGSKQDFSLMEVEKREVVLINRK